MANCMRGEFVMVKCTYWGLCEIYDTTFKEKINESLQMLIEKQDSVEFWFYTMGETNYEFLLCVMRAKICNPNKHIKIVRVTDDTKDWVSKAEYFLPCVADEVIHASAFVKPRNPFSVKPDRIDQISHWVIQQCDLIFSYDYPEISDRQQQNWIKRTAAKSNKQIFSIASDTTRAVITESMSALPEKEAYILNDICKGMTLKEIAIQRNLSLSGVKLHRNRAQRLLRELLKSRLGKKKNYDRRQARICGVFGLGDLSGYNLSFVTTLIDIQINEYGITDIWVEEKDGFSKFVLTLMKSYCINKARVTLVVRQAENNCLFVPPYDDVIITHSDFENRCRSIIKHSVFCITNLSNDLSVKQFIEPSRDENPPFIIDVSNYSPKIITLHTDQEPPR